MNQYETSLKPAILIAPLDWGLGHVTRCIPIIKLLVQKNCSVIIAAEGKVKALLQQEFPELTFVDLKGYNIHYSKNKWPLPFVIARQIPKIFSAIQYENKRLKEIVKQHCIDGIISDNRFGFYHPSIPSVCITHQLLIKTSFGKMMNKLVQKINYHYINRFSECWIPDYKSENNLAGELSHPGKQPTIPVHYVGALSRFQKMDVTEKNVLIILSGPEPQRTIFENMLMKQIKKYKQPLVLVRGLPDEKKELNVPENISVYNHLPSEELNQKLAEASVVISRCGYSTVMDLAVMKKKSILIPTPGQTEQEYLAMHLMKKNFALCIDQTKFQLNPALELASSFHYHTENFESHLETAVSAFLNTIQYSNAI